MPCGHTALREQPHRQGRGVDDAYAALLEVVEPVGQLIVAQAEVAEVEHRLHCALGHVVDDPGEVLDLQVGDAYVAHHALVAQLHERGQGLLGHLL